MKKNVLVRSVLLLAVMLFSFMGNNSAQTWQQVDIADLTASDVFVIVDLHSSCAMSNNNGTSAPSAVGITLNDGQSEITGDVDDNLKWNISGNATDGYTFYPNGDNTKWLYCNVSATTASGSNNNMRVGTGEAKTFVLHEGNWLAHVYTETHTRYVGVYNSSDWRGYTSPTTSNIVNTQTRFFKYSETVSSVETPVFSPNGGFNLEPQTVSISCETAGATIYYTLDGTTPNTDSYVYSEPFTLSANTTVKAIAYLGDASSNVATASFKFPVEIADIATLRAQATGSTVYHLTGEAVVTFTGTYRHHKYIKDETGAILIDDNSSVITSEYNVGDGMTGLYCTLTMYSNMLEAVPYNDPGAATSTGNAVTPLELTIDQVGEDYEAQLVKVANIIIDSTGVFAANTTYRIEGVTGVDLRIRYNEIPLVGTPIPTTAQNVTALVYQYGSAYDLVPISLEDYVPAPTECESVPTMGTCTAVLDNRDMLFSGQIAVDDPLCTLHEYGFVYSTTNITPMLDSVECTKVALGTTVPADSVFTHRIAELGFDTYYVRAFATNEVGTGYSEMASVQQAEPEIYSVNFLVNGHSGWTSVALMSIQEGESIVKFPVMENCGNLAFSGWALQPFEGQTSDRPTIFSTFAPTSDTTFYAVFSSSSNEVNDEIVISRASFENVAGYNTDDQWTAVSKVAGTEITGWCDLYTNNATMQMRHDRGSLPYNATALPGSITAITLYGASNTSDRSWTPYIASSQLSKETYVADGTSLETQTVSSSSSVTWEVGAELNATYFYIALSGGAAYIDSIVVAYTSGDYHYTMLVVDTVTIDQTICEGMTYEDDHFNTGEEGPHTYLLENNEYCATYYVLNLSLAVRDTIHHYVDTCDTYTLRDETYTDSQDVEIITPAAETYGCPVVDEWHITIRHSSEFVFKAVACDSYTWNDTIYYQSGDYTQTFTNAEGCDSTVTVMLIVNHSTHNVTDTTVCESFTWNENTYTASGTYTYDYVNENECASTDTLHLTVNYGTHNVTDTTVCGNFEWNGETYTTSGTYTYDYVNATECVSTDTLHLTVNHGDYMEVTVDTCSTEFYWEVSNATYSASGTYVFYSENANTCQDTAVLNLFLHPSVTTEFNAQICEGETYSQYGFNVSAAGNYQLDLQTVYGCDSTVILHLTMGSEAITNIAASICLGEDYVENGFNIVAPEVGVREYSHTIERLGTCDSTVVLTLTVNQPTEGDMVAVACSSFNWYGETLAATGDYTHVLTNAAGCDSTVTLHLTINVPTEGEMTATACNSYIWYGENLTESGDYTHVLEGGNAAGCDSTVTLHLTINVPTEGETSATACNSYSWYGETLTESGDYTHVLEGGNAAGCDSTVTLHLTINVPTEGETTATACSSYIWYGETLTTTGDYTHVLTNVAGCDSTVTLHLTINVPTEGETTATACSSYSWYGETLTESGDYTYVLEGGNAAGCDSTVTLHLTINVPSSVEISDTACSSYSWNDSIYTESGDYVQTFTDANGCDSVVTLHLTVITINTEISEADGYLTVTPQENATYQWIDCATNAPIEGETDYGYGAVEGDFACVITIGECVDTTECWHVYVGVAEHGMADIILYPNPTTGIVSIRLTPETCTLKPEIHLFDIYGRRLQVLSVTGETTQIDLSRYATGIYIVKLVNGGKVVAVKKVVKE